jgi:hypothetical protein
MLNNADISIECAMKLNPRNILWRLNRYEFDFWHLTFIVTMLTPSFGNPLILAKNRSKLRDSSGIIQTIV